MMSSILLEEHIKQSQNLLEKHLKWSWNLLETHVQRSQERFKNLMKEEN